MSWLVGDGSNRLNYLFFLQVISMIASALVAITTFIIYYVGKYVLYKVEIMPGNSVSLGKTTAGPGHVSI